MVRIGAKVAVLPAIPELPQIGGDGRIQACGLGSLADKQCCEPRHLLVEGLVVLLLRRGAHVPARREHVAVGTHLVECRALAEAPDVVVLSRPPLAPARSCSSARAPAGRW